MDEMRRFARTLPAMDIDKCTEALAEFQIYMMNKNFTPIEKLVLYAMLSDFDLMMSDRRKKRE